MSRRTTPDNEVLIVGGGPAGALTAMLLARLGHEVAVLERAPRWRWRACGVFTSPASVAALRGMGIEEAELARVARPVEAMEVRSGAGTRFALTYGGTGALADSAVGFDRSALDPFLLELAASAGAAIERGVSVESAGVGGPRARLRVRTPAGGAHERTASIVVGADGIRSIVARAAGVVRKAPLGRRAALTFHVADPGLGETARMVVLEDGYVGLAPVPGGRLNVGIVVGPSWLPSLRRDGGPAVARRLLAEALSRTTTPAIAATGPFEPLDRVAGVSPLGHAVARRAGPSWLLAGDAAGFLDPFTGEGLHRAIRSAELAAEAIHGVLGGRPGASLASYDDAMRREFETKDLVSRIVQAFLARPALFDYAARRLAGRPRIRDTMALVMGDLVPASSALDPRFLAALLCP